MPTPQERILRYYEEIVARQDEEREQIPEPMRERYYQDQLVQYRHILRMVRLNNDLPICWGAVDCVETIVINCAGGGHTVCRAHAKTCYMCKGADA